MRACTHAQNAVIAIVPPRACKHAPYGANPAAMAWYNFTAEFHYRRNAMAHTIVIFGASGDLTSRKLIPALYELHRKKRLPADTRVVGFSRTKYGHDVWRQKLGETTAQFVGQFVRRRAVAGIRRLDLLSSGRHRQRRGLSAVEKLSGGTRRRASRHARLLSGHRAAALRPHCRATRRGGPGRRGLAAPAAW